MTTELTTDSEKLTGFNAICTTNCAAEFLPAASVTVTITVCRARVRLLRAAPKSKVCA